MCGTEWKMFKIGTTKRCLKYMGQTSLQKAFSVCRQVFGFLPLLNDKDEDSDFFSAVKSLGFKNAIIDGTDKAQEGFWRNTRNNQALFYFNWAPNQPDNGHFQNNEHFLHYHPGMDKWNDQKGSFKEHLFCEKSGKILFKFLIPLQCSLS